MTVATAKAQIQAVLDQVAETMEPEEYDEVLDWLGGEADCRQMAAREAGEIEEEG
jgi:hypothetical protein